MKILHTADLHLKAYRDERWGTLETIVDIADKEDVDILAISGDLFDKNIDSEALRPRIRGIFSDRDFKIIIIPGNHDCDSYKKGMYFGEDVVVLTDMFMPFEQEEVVFWGMPFEQIDGIKILNKLFSLTNKLANEKKNILLFHGELLDAFFSRNDFGDEGEERYMPVKLSYFNDIKLDYVLAGHFHSKFEIRRLHKGGYWVYPGSPISITRRETGQRKINIFETGGLPQEYKLNSPYFEEMVIEFDPFNPANPVDVLKEKLNSLPANAKLILNVKGFINSNAIGMSEVEIHRNIKDFFGSVCIEQPYIEFTDIQNILENDLFKTFLKKLEQKQYDEHDKRLIRDFAIRAIMGFKS